MHDERDTDADDVPAGAFVRAGALGLLGALPLLARLRIGRNEDNEVVVPDLLVSRYHAELRKVPYGGYEIFDLDSSNGTYLNGRQLKTAERLKMADVIRIGDTEYRYRE